MRRRYRRPKSLILLLLLCCQNGRCFYCRRRLRHAAATLDHYRPLAKGGGDRLSNLVVACFRCNNEKADRDPAEFLTADERP